MTVENETIEISKTLYDALLDDQKFLQALKEAGVNNWGGYDYALEVYYADTEIE
jgi:hypothetical protein